jgi:hypothetical protein
MKIEGSGSASGSISQRHESADPYPDQHQNVMDPQHCTALDSEHSYLFRHRLSEHTVHTVFTLSLLFSIVISIQLAVYSTAV